MPIRPEQIQIMSSDANLYIIMLGGIIIILCMSILFKYYTLNNYSIKSTNSNKQCVISNDMYPEINNIINQKSVILDELTEIIKTGIWSKWSDSSTLNDLAKTPRFSDMTQQQKVQHLENNKTCIGKDAGWKIYGLILERQPINKNISMCPETYKMIKDITGLINAGFSCLEPHSMTPYHSDKDARFYRIHIPLIVPFSASNDELGMIVKNQSNNNISRLNWSTDYFVFDDTCEHQAFNNTDCHRIVLLLDIERR